LADKIAIIGAGIGGLAASIRLAAKGYDVEVFEKNSTAGGKLSEIRHQGFRFDTGPSLFTMPEWIEELYKVASQADDQVFQYKRIDNICRYFFPDGMMVNGLADVGAFARELEVKAGESPDKVRAYFSRSRDIYEWTREVFLLNSLHIPSNYLRWPFIRSYPRLTGINAFTSLHRVNARHFSHPNTVQLFDRFATYNGSDPYRAPATLMVIPHLEHGIGAYFPVEGMYGIVRAMQGLSEKLGVKFHFDTPVQQVLTAGRNVVGLMAGGIRVPFRYIISDIDVHYLYKNLLSRLPFPGRRFRHERSTSALIFYWGMSTTSPDLDLHNIFFSEDYRQEFRDLFFHKIVPSDPTVYLFISSKHVASDAPPGCENWFAMINTPENVGQDWDGFTNEARHNIMAKINRMLGFDVKQHILFEYVLDPRGIEARTSSYRGSLYGDSSNNMFSAFRRHPNFIPSLSGLFLTGGSVHPGGGIPLCLASAKIVADLIPGT
jgi:phytoene desaturase